MSDSAADPFDLHRFVLAQEGAYATALAELTQGQKQSHWIWFVLPQLRGLGRSPMSQRYGLSGLPEAGAYWSHPVLGPRLRACVQATLLHPLRSAREILGEIDAAKYQSCLTLFELAAGPEPLLAQALDGFYAGRRDLRTRQLLGLA